MVALAFYATTCSELNTAEQVPLLRNVNVAIVIMCFHQLLGLFHLPYTKELCMLHNFPPSASQNLDEQHNTNRQRP